MNSKLSTNNSLSDDNIARLMLAWVKAVNAKDTETAHKIKKDIDMIRKSCPDCTL